ISIVIVSWNVADLLVKCLASIYANTPAPYTIETIVVDSASGDDTVERVHSEFPQVTMLAQAENVGFTRGNNIGLKAARGRWLFLLNPDTEIHGDVITQLADYLQAHPKVGIVGPRTLNSDGSDQATRRYFPSLLLEWMEGLWYSFHFSPLPPTHLPPDDPPADSTHPVEWLQGSALMAQRTLYDQIGGLDEGFFMFSEEVDWCKRAADAGWQIVYVGSGTITHHGGRSTDQVATATLIRYYSSKVRYFRKHHGALQAALLRLYIEATYLGKMAIEGAKYLLGHKRDLRRERLIQYRQLLRSGLAG
ncbi:MAG: glycosyltransferase family 2 protein, partial [Anaerolineae bacterium]